MLTIICALDRQRAIGYENRLLFRLSDDLKHFKALTTGHTVIMGRKTFESLPKGALPNRRNIVLSRNGQFTAENIEVFSSLTNALAATTPNEEIFIIGGASVYAEALPLADRLCLTEVDAEAAQADVYFPDFDLNQWEERQREKHEADERNVVPFAFVDYYRKSI